MENSWLRKCGGSVGLTLQEQQQSQNRILNRNLYLHSSAGACSTSPSHKLAPEAVNHWNAKLTADNMSVTEMSSSFLPLLSGPPRIYPSEVLLSRSEVLPSSSRPYGQNVSGQCTETGADLSWFVSSTSGANANHGGNSGPNVLAEGFPADVQQWEVPKADTDSNSRNETCTICSYPILGCLDGATSSSVRKIHVGNTAGVSQRDQRKTDSSTSCSSSSFLMGGPRVFCLGLTGNLIISNSRLLGVVCSCHCRHMSISKFAEHSGSYNVSPGNAVHVEGGETIDQWRKAYFHKFGIRVPEDYTGWDWPQGTSATAGLSQQCPTPANFFADSPFYNQANNPFGGALHSLSQSNYNLLPPKNSQFGKNVDDFFHRDRQKSFWEDSRMKVEGLSISTENGLPFMAEDQIPGYSRSGSVMLPNLIGVRKPCNVRLAKSFCKDPIFGSENSLLHSDMLKLHSPGKDVSDGSNVGSFVEDTTSSNFELKLGQPSQHDEAVASGSLVMAVPGSHFVVHRQPRRPVFIDQHLHQTSTSRSIGKSEEHNLAGVMRSSIFNAEKTGLNDLNQLYGVFGVSKPSQLKVFGQSAVPCAVASESLTSRGNPSEGKHQFQLSIDRQWRPSPANVGQFGVPPLREKIRDMGFSINMLDSQENQKDGLWFTSELNLGNMKPVAELSFNGVASDSAHCQNPGLQDKVSDMCQFTGTMTNIPDMRNTLKNSGQFSGHEKNGLHDPISSRTIGYAQAQSLWNSAKKSVPVKSFTELTNSCEAGRRPYFADESLRISPLQSISTIHCDIVGAAGTFKPPQEHIESQNYHQQTQCNIPQMLLSRKSDFHLTNVPNAAAIATPLSVTTDLGIEQSEKLPSATGDSFNFQASPALQRYYSQGKDAECHFQLHSDLDQRMQWFMRVGSHTNIASSSKGDKCYQEVTNPHFHNSMLSYSDCLPGRLDLSDDPSLCEFGDREASAVNLVAPVFGPNLGERFTYSDQNNSFAATKKAECSTSEWRDVPTKVVKYTNEADKKCSEKSYHYVLKGQEMSNLSSGCSAPAVSQTSTEANKNSFTVDGALTVNNVALDEGSSIETCDSTDDEKGRKSAESHSFPSQTDLISFSHFYQGLKNEPLSRGSLKLRKLASQNGSCFPVQTKGKSQNFEYEPRRGKRNMMKLKRSDPSVPASVLCAAQNETFNCETKARQTKNLHILSQSDQQSFTGCPCSVGQTSRKVRKLSTSGAVSQKRDLGPGRGSAKNLTNRNYTEADEAMRIKRLRLLDDIGDLDREKHSTSFVSELASKSVVVDHNATSGVLANVFCGRRPIVCGKYGVLSNANSQKPAKIVSLSTVLKAARRCSYDESGKLDFGAAKESKKAFTNVKKAVKNRVTSGNEKSHFLASEDSCDLSHTMKKRRNDGKRSCAVPDYFMNTHFGRKYKQVRKQVRKRSLNELTVKGNDSNKVMIQSEVEGVNNQSVGFYGRCVVHEIYHQQTDDFDSGHSGNVDHGEREPTCARTEGYKGRKLDGFTDNCCRNSDAVSGCLVPQEQLNAWIHIHDQRSSARGGPLKPPTSTIEHDSRGLQKEYARYKQLRGWKHFVVYKSRIHGLGLYTSQFICRGAMVVEYVGEIVGVHIADKRETEYQAGKKLQYKSACYFFKIDKEHIIDATRKGGIARFVNHSCSPNCVAKVISVRNEKKVVFFAERDIYPGEEVTYDYHFNHEDEGKKLPCFCKSKNCRQYLN